MPDTTKFRPRWLRPGALVVFHGAYMLYEGLLFDAVVRTTNGLHRGICLQRPYDPKIAFIIDIVQSLSRDYDVLKMVIDGIVVVDTLSSTEYKAEMQLLYSHCLDDVFDD